MQIERHHAIGAGARDQVGDELGRDRRARARLAVLPGIAEIGHDRRDPPCRGAPQRIDDDQQLHQMVVRRERRRLEDEHVGAADVLLDLDEDLHVGEPPDDRSGECNGQVGGDRLGEPRIGVAGHELDRSVLARHGLPLAARAHATRRPDNKRPNRLAIRRSSRPAAFSGWSGEGYRGGSCMASIGPPLPAARRWGPAVDVSGGFGGASSPGFLSSDLGQTRPKDSENARRFRGEIVAHRDRRPGRRFSGRHCAGRGEEGDEGFDAALRDTAHGGIVDGCPRIAETPDDLLASDVQGATVLRVVNVPCPGNRRASALAARPELAADAIVRRGLRAKRWALGAPVHCPRKPASAVARAPAARPLSRRTRCSATGLVPDDRR